MNDPELHKVLDSLAREVRLEKTPGGEWFWLPQSYFDVHVQPEQMGSETGKGGRDA